MIFITPRKYGFHSIKISIFHLSYALLLYSDTSVLSLI